MTTRDFSGDPRISRMYLLDCVIIIVSLAATWAALLFVLREALSLAVDPAVKRTILVAAAAAGVASTAALVAVLVHLKGNRRALYSEDLVHLDAAEEAGKS
jgi:hypothetical protein